MFPQPFEDQRNSINLSRKELLAEIEKKSRFEVLIVGGGIHGAAMARLCALNGLSCVLLEKSDYASQTSSRSSKMAHGGLRYLEMLDLPLVFEGIRAREDLFEVAPHLVQPERFLIPIYRGENWKRLKLKIGLSLYDLLCRNKDRHHRWIDRESVPAEVRQVLAAEIQGAFEYCDGVMDDTRLVIESIFAARQEGAICLNYCEALHVETKASEVNVSVIDHLNKQRFNVRAGIVVNCCGPWVANMGRLTAGELSKQLRFSRGSHLIFSVAWKLPPLFFALAEKNRYYWIWPHFAGTLVGTTERSTDELSNDVMPSSDEIDEILNRLERDAPKAGLTRKSLHYCFAGVRTLVTKSSNGETGSISRRHRWIFQAGVLSLLGGKFTSAFTTAHQGLRKVYKLARIKGKPASLKGRKLPGAAGDVESCNAWHKKALDAGVPFEVIVSTERRLGRRVRLLADDFEVFANLVLKSEVEMMLEFEQVEQLEDLMRRRLLLEYLPNHGLEALDQITHLLAKRIGSEQALLQAQEYRQRVLAIDKLCKG